MSYYQLNRQEILHKAKEKYYRNLSEEEENKIKVYQKKKYQELIQYKTEALKNK